MRSGRIVRTAVLFGLLAAGAALAARAGLGSGVLHLAPALVLFAALLARRYPGERHVVALTVRGRRPRRRGRAAIVLVTPRPSRSRPRGGLLLASALAERGPPAALAAR
jgi:hypothetical protein